MSIWNETTPVPPPPPIVLAEDPPDDAPVSLLWGDLRATLFVNPDGTRDTDG